MSQEDVMFHVFAEFQWTYSHQIWQQG